ncbi:GTP pyrophosphokinase [Enterobacter sp. N18-03635]|uniref:GTP pyrophosphokinase n=1 Tax=Enterobacter sp. N18-03635 TaxID=2500132 RepID=UPI000FD6EEEC|nr:GTP pyrophosphokinase [Enterobacter sp. N18-03635]AZV05723.1 GTP pyrophosphokinase [Enterobacter sp. N18-03635]
MTGPKILDKFELIERVSRFYNRYGSDLEQISELLKIRLTQLALAYTIKNNLPPEAIRVLTRVKSQSSFLKKLENKKWPQFYYPTDIIKDLVGARVICWFIDDCYGIKSFISSSKHIVIDKNIEDYITEPKESGYRSIHLQGSISYDAITRDIDSDEIIIGSKNMACEIQIRTKLQDAWADITHEFHYKAKNAGVDNQFYEESLSQISDRLRGEEKAILTLRNAYQKLADEKTKENKREGFQST